QDENIEVREQNDDDARMNGLFDDSMNETHEEGVVQNQQQEEIKIVHPDVKIVEKEADEADDTPKYQDWKFPPIDLLQEPIVRAQNKEVYKKNALVIEQTLRSFGVQAKVVEVSVGPTVVQYALSISVGTKVS